ncbi:Colicin I receptor [Rhodocyclaceae bacterium]|nr:Colicin I receptor [Rhodocyclaceae bacterium]
MLHLPFKRKLIALAIIAAASPVASAAPADAPVAELGTVTVSVGRGSKLEDMDMSTTVMTREQIQEAPQTSVEQILSRIPGIFTPQQPSSQVHPTSQVFSIRGFGTVTTINTLLMIDGVPANDPYFRTIDWTQIPKDSIERIEVIRGGGATSLWGNMAMGGIVNVVTREPAAGERRINASYGSFNTKTGDFAATLYASDQLKVGMTVGGTKSDGYNKVPSEYRNQSMVAPSSITGNVSLSATFTPSKDSKYYLRFAGHEAKQEGSLYWNNTRTAWDKYQVSGGGSTKLDEGGSINVAGWYNSTEMDTTNAGTLVGYNILTPSVPMTPYQSQIEQAKYSSLGGSFFYQTDFGSIKDLKVGLDLRSAKVHDVNNFFGAAGPTAKIIARAEHRFEGLFIQGTYRPADIPLDITLGLREDFFQTEHGNLDNTLAGAATKSTPLANKRYTQFDPRLGLKYLLSEELDVRAAAYRNFAAPGMNQMYRSTRSGTSYLAPNASLIPMDNRGREFGLDFKRGGFDVAFTLFHNTLKNFIDYVPVCTAGSPACDTHPAIVGTGFEGGGVKTINQYVNAGDAVIKGAELLGNWKASETVQFNGGVTRTRAFLIRSDYTAIPNTTSPAAPTNVQLGQIPAWMATLGSSWQATPNLNLTLQFKRFPSFWNNTAHTQRNDGASLVDLGMTYKASKTIDIYGSIQNLGNKKYLDQGLTVTAMEGSTLSTGGIPALGMPLNMTVGVRASF